MRLFFLGDIKTNTGPAIVNKNLKKNLPSNTLYSEKNNIIIRILETLIKVIKSDVIICSGLSYMNIIAFNFAHILKKKTFYLMHGYAQIENQYNGVKSKKSKKTEYKCLKKADKIICVSEKFSEYLKKELPQYEPKITFVNNGIEWENEKKQNYSNNEKKYNICSIGGGVKIKNIVGICEAIKRIEQCDKRKIQFIVIGKKTQESEKIKNYSFVTYYEKMSHEDIMKTLKQCDLYIQNSYFESFGLACIEALISGCNLLISKDVGAISIMEKIEQMDIIYNQNNYEEICLKIKNIMDGYNNNKKILNGIDKIKTSWNNVAKDLMRICTEEKR